jgi:carbon-monoxide dehydrogenase medium subunit
MPGIAVACDARIVIAGPAGERVCPASEFFVGALSTTLAPDEIITQVRLPAWTSGRRHAFEEFSRRKGDFAVAGIAVHYLTGRDGAVADAHVGVIGACHTPHRVPAVEALLNGKPMSPKQIEAAAAALPAALDAPDDIHASAAYRQALAATLLKRALLRASTR